MSTKAVSISISIPYHYLEVIDQKRQRRKRSEWIFEAILRQLDEEVRKEDLK